VSGLLLFATMINYMDRQTLANVSVRVTVAFGLTEEQYGDLEFAFGWAFAAGSLLFGFLVDRVSVRWLYPAALLGWSAAGFLTGLAASYDQLLACRTLLGIFEAGHWPCALATTQRLLSRSDRTLGNSVLQSGASIGAILTPLIVIGIIRYADPGEPVRLAHFAAGGGMAVGATGVPPSVWQLPFLAVGAVGTLWVFAWLAVVRSGDVAKPTEPTGRVGWSTFLDRRFVVLFVMVTCLNTTWQIVRAWLPKFLIQGRGYPEAEALYFNSAYYVATDVGCLAAGGATLWLARRGVGVHASRLGVFAVCAAMTALTVVAAELPRGWPLLGVLLVVGAGSLGLFPCYYSFTQELSTAHIGKVTGLLAAAGWFISSPVQKGFGRLVDVRGSYDLGFAVVGLAPLAALGVMLLFWRRGEA
jgi:ACS family hexuronate transporter-like MFS transporter